MLNRAAESKRKIKGRVWWTACLLGHHREQQEGRLTASPLKPLLGVLGVQILEILPGDAEDASEAFGIVVRERTFVLDDGFDLGYRNTRCGGELQQAHAVAFNEIALKDLAKRFERGGGIGHSCSPKRRAPDWPGASFSSNAFGPRAQYFVPVLAGI